MKALILMSTYNGETYLAEQLDSIIAQTHKDWVLLIRDDGSSDNTVNIIRTYQQKHNQVQLLTDNFGNLNSCQSFGKLMEVALERNEDYIFCSDQDDIWLPEKLEKSITVLKELNSKHGDHTPLLVHTDLTVVDHSLKLIHPSYLRQEGLTRNTTSPIRTLLINNYVTGCTMGMNRALLKIAAPIPESAIMHDWWCALCAAVYGEIGFISEPTILYRQHPGNAIGSQTYIKKFIGVITFKKSFAQRLKHFRSCLAQASELLTRLNPDNTNHNLIRSFSSIPTQTLMERYSALKHMQIRAASLPRKILFMINLALA